jgi:dienelactone hydrolase
MSAKIFIDRPELLVDEPVTFTVEGCTPGEPVTVSASWEIGRQPVRTEAHFVAPASGVVDPAKQPSTGGTYTGVEPYGLWWSIDVPEVPDDPDPLTPWTVSVAAAGPDWETSGSLVRRKVAPAVRKITVEAGRLRGIAFFPEGEGPFPSVLVYSGSGGGLGGLGGVQSSAALLASRGFAAFALAYFRYEDLPPDLVNIPLEYFREGIDWLRKNAPALGGRVAVMGASRGGELSLLLGSTYPDDVSAVVAKVPSGIVWGGLTKDRAGHEAAWTLGGLPVEPLRGRSTPTQELPKRDGAIVLTPAFEAQLAAASAEDISAHEVPVERLGGPALLLSGEDDAMWPSVALAEYSVKRAQARGARFPVRHLSYPDAGHSFTIPAGFPVPRASVHPVDGNVYAYGGSLVGNAHANASSWREILDFLDTNLPGKPSPGV